MRNTDGYHLQAPTSDSAAPPQARPPLLPSGSWLRDVCRLPRTDHESLPVSALSQGSNATQPASVVDESASPNTQALDDTPPSSEPPKALDQNFEDEFEKHLKKSNKTSRMRMGAVGAGIGAGLTLMATPVGLPGLLLAGLAGGAGGHQLGKMKGRRRLQKHCAKSTGTGPTSSVVQHQRPALRRLRYLVRWGHWQLLEYETAPLQWRTAVLTEVAKAFSQWVQALFLVRVRLGGGMLEENAEAQEIFQHLAPLYQCLQRSVFSEATSQACTFVDAAFASHTVDTGHVDLCRVAFPTILETISIMDRLAPSTQAKLAEEKEGAGSPISTSKHRPKSSSEFDVARPVAVQKTQGRQRLRKVVDAIRGVLEQPDIAEALSNPKVLERFQSAAQQEDADASADAFCTETSLGLTRAESDADLDFSSSRPSSFASLGGEGGEHRRSSSSLNRVSLVVPPEGVEEEADEKEFHSCSEEEDEDQTACTGAASSTACTGASQPPGQRATHLAASHGSVAGAPAVGRFKDRLADFPRGRGNHQWDKLDASKLHVRSASYLKDRKKAPSAPALLELVNTDFFKIPPSGPILHPATARGFYPLEQRRQKDGRFLFIQNWIVAPFQAIIVSALDPHAPWLEKETPQSRSWNRFLTGSIDYQKNAFKVMVSVEDGPWLVKRAVPQKPVLVGRQLKMDTRYEPGEYLEITIDVSNSKADAMAVGIVMKALSRLELVLGMLIEGKQEDELPETLLVCAAMKGIDTSRLVYPDESWTWE